jgi:hypothetical protein
MVTESFKFHVCQQTENLNTVLIVFGSLVAWFKDFKPQPLAADD